MLETNIPDCTLLHLCFGSLIRTNSGGKYFRIVLGGTAEFAKNVLRDGDTVILASRQPFTAFDKDDVLDFMKSDSNKFYVFNDFNWFCTLGNANSAIVAKITRKGDKYHMDYRYIVYDYYDWDVKDNFGIFDIPYVGVSNSDFAQMHFAGIARSYYQQGQLTGDFDYDKKSEPYDSWEWAF